MKPTIGMGEDGLVGIDLNNLIDTRLLIQANSGGGKSYAIRKLLEETHGKVQHIVLDLGASAGISPTSGTFGTYIATLKRNGLINVNGEGIRISDELR